MILIVVIWLNASCCWLIWSEDLLLLLVLLLVLKDLCRWLLVVLICGEGIHLRVGVLASVKTIWLVLLLLITIRRLLLINLLLRRLIILLLLIELRGRHSIVAWRHGIIVCLSICRLALVDRILLSGIMRRNLMIDDLHSVDFSMMDLGVHSHVDHVSHSL